MESCKTVFALVAHFHSDKTVQEIKDNTHKIKDLFTHLSVENRTDSLWSVFGKTWQVRRERGGYIRVGY